MIPEMYITMMPVILAGIINMIFTKTKFYKKRKYPIDNYHCWRDGKQIFGNNKTRIGFLSMIVISFIVTILWGNFCKKTGLEQRNELYRIYDNTIIYNGIMGFYFGFTYMLFELPNSFLKRRLDISPGQTKAGGLGIFFFLYDQIDSLIGVMLLLFFVAHISLGKYIFYIILGALTHIGVNFILYKLKIRRNL